MSERLNREAVERQIREMWDALIDQTGADAEAYLDLDQAKEAARQCEQRLRERLDTQDRLDAAAPELLNALELALATLERLHCQHAPACMCINGTLDYCRHAIARTKRP